MVQAADAAGIWQEGDDVIWGFSSNQCFAFILLPDMADVIWACFFLLVGLGVIQPTASAGQST